MKASVLIWQHYKKKDGTYPIKIKTSHTENGKTIEKYFPLNAFATLSQWDEKNKMVKPSHPNSQVINRKIATMMLDIQNQIISNDTVVFSKNKRTSVIGYYEFLLEGMKTKHSAGYYNTQNSIKNKLKEYNPGLSFENIRPSDIKNYETYLIKLGNGRNTIHNNLKRIKYVFQEAVKEGLLEYSKNPFNSIRLESAKTKKRRITYEQILEIENLELKENSSIWHTRNYWLFSFYCAGIRFGDLCRMNKRNIKTESGKKRLVYVMNKTSKARNILLIDQAVKIINIYAKAHKSLLFGIIDTLPTDPFDELRVIAAKNTIANKNLKTLAKMIKSDVDLTFHSSRHSFADYAKQCDMDMHTIKDMLGHDKFSTTEIYMQDFYQESTDAGMNKMFNRS